MFLSRHSENVTTPLVLSVMDSLKQDYGIRTFAISGYCFGGLYATRLAQNNTVKVVTMAHPFALDVPHDFEVVQNQSHVPVQIQSGEFDFGLTPDLAAKIDVTMADYSAGYSHVAWGGVPHGFAVAANKVRSCLLGCGILSPHCAYHPEHPSLRDRQEGFFHRRADLDRDKLGRDCGLSCTVRCMILIRYDTRPVLTPV